MEFDPQRLEIFLKDKLPDLQGAMQLERIGGGQSNPTFFVSFDNRLPEMFQLFVTRVPRDEVFIRLIEAEIVQFIAELDDKINKLMKVKNV
jgi:aminoglycoside phosphotransferase (APT) family kinase protein